MRRIVVCVLTALIVAAWACGGSPTGPTAAPSSLATRFSLADTSGERLFETATIAPDAISCPHGAPAQWQIGTHETQADFTWSAVPGATNFVIAVERHTVLNVWVPVAMFVTDAVTRAERTVRENGDYRARIRTRVCGDDGQSVWSAWALFTIDGGADGGLGSDGGSNGGGGGSTSGGGGSTTGDIGGTSGGGGGSTSGGGGGSTGGCPVELPEQARPDCPPGHGGTPPGQEGR